MNRLGSKQFILCIFGLATLAWAVWINPEIYFVSDEAVYHMMTLSLANEGNLFIWNGYEEFPSQELVLDHSRIYDGRLYPQYPILFSIISMPFVYILGFKGFYLINTIALLAATFICYKLAKLLFEDTDLATNACLIFLFATYAWEYGQTAWPHAVSVFFVVLSTYLACLAYREAGSFGSTATALGAGLAAGLGVGVRLDTFLVMPAIIAPFLFATPWRPREALAIGAGAIPALGILTLSNYLKFGILSPLSYGATSYPRLAFESYVPIVALGLVGVVTAWLVTRGPARDRLGSRRGVVTAGLVLLGAVAFAALDLWAYGARLVTGTLKLLIDLGIQQSEALRPDEVRGPGGAIISNGAVKKAFLQSCPYLAAAAIPAAALMRGSEDRGPLSMLFLVPAAFVAFYSYFAWHGGGALNLRYFLPSLPFCAILVAYAWRELDRGLSNRWSLPRLTVAAAATIVFLSLLALSETIGKGAGIFVYQQVIFRGVPLVIFVVILGFALMVAIAGKAIRPKLCGATSLLLVGAFVWSGLTAFNNDFFRAFAFRHARGQVLENLGRVVEPDSIVFTNAPNNFLHLLVEDRVRIAVPSRDQFKDFDALRRFHSERGRATYIWLEPGMVEGVRQLGLLDNLETVQVLDFQGVASLARIIDPDAPAQAPSSAPD